MTKEEFKALIDRYLSGTATAAEERLIEDFFSTGERNRSQVSNVMSEGMWSSIAEHIHGKDLVHNINPAGKKNSLRSGRRILVPVSIALILVSVMATVLLRGLSVSRQEERQWVRLDAPHGQKSIITLADGSRIFLNAGSSISYPEVFLPEKREVKLEGEAFFQVAENPRQPFIVTTGKLTTKVLGTSFNIQAFPERAISVTVATGKVQVEATVNPSVSQDSGSASRAILLPNDQAIYNPGGSVITIAEVDVEKYLAWKDNTLLFDDMSIEEVASILERWYNVTIAFDSELIQTCRINGKYKDQSLENVLKSIQYMYHIDYRFSGQNAVILSGKGCKVKPRNTS